MTPYLSGTFNYDLSAGGSVPGGVCTLLPVSNQKNTDTTSS